MKLRILILAAGISVLASCGGGYRATDTSTVVIDVPSTTQSAFMTQYPGATNVVWLTYDQVPSPIDWEMSGWTTLDNQDYVVKFYSDKQDQYAWYDENGNWVGTAYVVNDYKMLPVSVNTTIAAKYPGYTITSAHREMQKDRTAYELRLQNGDSRLKVLLDADGNVIREKTKE